MEKYYFYLFFQIYFILFIYDAVTTHYNLFPEHVPIIESKFITDSFTNALYF